MANSSAMKRIALPFGHLSVPQSNDLTFALSLTEVLTPTPAKAHTALLILRDRLADAVGVSVADLMQAHAAGPNTTDSWPHTSTGTPKP